MELLFLGHRRPAFATCQDDCLAALRNRELALQFGGGGEERRDARRDVIVHAVRVEEGHLLLNGTEDAGVASMQTDDEVAAVVVLLHQLALLLEGHVGRRAHDGSRLVAVGQRLGHQRTGI